MITVVTLTSAQPPLIQQCAQLLVDELPGGWSTLAAALDEMAECLQPGHILRLALDEASNVVGWIGGRPSYDGNVWELHPLVVRPDQQRKGIGRLLVQDLEAQVKRRGGLIITLGTDDLNDQTSLGGVDLYPDPLEHLQQIRNLHGHPYEFYQKVGFVLTGVLPDANGFGKPDIFMSKRVA